MFKSDTVRKMCGVIGLCSLISEAQATETQLITLRALDKVTGRFTTLDAAIGEEINFGNLIIRADVCHKSSPEEAPENAAFLSVKVRYPEEKELFKGWMFSSNPALSPMEDPIYDLWVVDCMVDEHLMADQTDFSETEETETTDPVIIPTETVNVLSDEKTEINAVRADETKEMSEVISEKTSLTESVSEESGTSAQPMEKSEEVATTAEQPMENLEEVATSSAQSVENSEETTVISEQPMENSEQENSEQSTGILLPPVHQEEGVISPFEMMETDAVSSETEDDKEIMRPFPVQENLKNITTETIEKETLPPLD